MGVWVGVALFAVSLAVMFTAGVVAFVAVWVSVRDAVVRAGGVRLVVVWRVREWRRKVSLGVRLFGIDVRRRWGFLRAAWVLLRVSLPVWAVRYGLRVRVVTFLSAGGFRVCATWRCHRLEMVWYRFGVVSATLDLWGGRKRGFMMLVPAVR